MENPDLIKIDSLICEIEENKNNDRVLEDKQYSLGLILEKYNENTLKNYSILSNLSITSDSKKIDKLLLNLK